MSNIYPPNKCFTCKKNNVSAFNGTYCVEHIPKTTRPPIKPDIEQELDNILEKVHKCCKDHNPYETLTPPEAKALLEQLINKVETRARLMEWQSVVDLKKTPTHGTCCTCQDCGYPNDNECKCEIIDYAEFRLKGLKANLVKEEDK